MACLTRCAATLIFLTASSSIIIFYGPILGTALLITVALYARAVTDLRLRGTTRQRRRRRSGKETRTTEFRRRGTHFQALADRNGNAHWTEGRF